jgi:hypothetical protein
MKKAGDLLSLFFDSGMIKKAQGYHDLFSAWASIAGENIAAHSRIVELERSVLLVEADHPGWVQILQTKQKVLLQGVIRRFPDLTITGISFRLGRDPAAETQGAETPLKDIDDPDIPPPEPEEGFKAPVLDDPRDDSSGGPASDPYAKITDEKFKETLKRLERNINSRGGRK